MEECDSLLAVYCNHIARRQTEVLCVPVKHLLKFALRIANPVMSPFVYWSWAEFEPLASSYPGLLILVVDPQLLQALG